MSIVILLIIAATVFFSVQGLRSQDLLARYSFYVDGVQLYQQYYRIISGGFVHADWWHLGLNMLVLLLLGPSAVNLFGVPVFLLLYFGSLVGGHLLALLVNRNRGWYRAVGASGAINGVIFAVITFNPDMRILLLFFPIPGWIFGIAYILISIWGIQNQRDSGIGHEAHLSGALIGILTTCLMFPDAVKQHPWFLLATVVPIVVFMFVIIRFPESLIIPNFWKKKAESVAQGIKKESRFDSAQDELDFLLDKVHRKGINSLSAKERARLDDLSSNFPS